MCGDDTGHDIVDIGEVSLHIPMIEHFNRAVIHDRIGEKIQRHIRPTPRAVHSEKPEPGLRQSI